jgi:signal transduction histidine kinase
MLAFDMNISQVRATLDEFCGVSIYRNGFRVHPYGESGDDWLGLDNRSRQNPTMKLAKNQIISSIKISRHNNPELRDRTTREGLVHTPEFEKLKEWYLRILAVLEECRYRIRPREESKPEYSTTLFEVFDMSDVILEARQQLGKTHPLAKLVKAKDHTIRDGVKKLQEHYSRVLLAAGLGQLVDLVIHEIGAPLGRVNREVLHLRRTVGKYEFDEQETKNFDKSFDAINGWLGQIGTLRQRLDPKTAGKRGRATTFSVVDEIEGNLNLYGGLIKKQKIVVDLVAPKRPIVVHMSQSSLGQVVANLIDNSVYWLTRHHGDGKGGKIKIELLKLPHGFRIDYLDDGPGILDRDKERIFEQYFTLKPNGMGLGLFIARQVIEPYGRLLYEAEGELSGAHFVAEFVKNVGL